MCHAFTRSTTIYHVRTLKVDAVLLPQRRKFARPPCFYFYFTNLKARSVALGRSQLVQFLQQISWKSVNLFQSRFGARTHTQTKTHTVTEGGDGIGTFIFTFLSPMLSNIRKNIAVWKVRRLRLFDLLVWETCRWRLWRFGRMNLAEETRSISWKIYPSGSDVKMESKLNYMSKIQFVPNSKNRPGFFFKYGKLLLYTEVIVVCPDIH
jgi:hypothetical protein